MDIYYTEDTNIDIEYIKLNHSQFLLESRSDKENAVIDKWISLIVYIIQIEINTYSKI